MKDFNLSADELKQIVEGAQQFLPPTEDPLDDEFFRPVDQIID